MSTSGRSLRQTSSSVLSGKRGLFFFVFLVLLPLFVSCECWEDWCDGDKPPPPDPITPPHVARTVYTRDEALSLVCNKLIMKFSMMSGKPSITCRTSDDMTSGVTTLLRKANAISQYPADAGNVCTLESVPAEPGYWHPVAVQVSTGKVLLDETIKLSDEGNGSL